MVSQDDVAEMNQQPAVDRVHWLLEVVKRRGLHTVARFVECLRESPENAKSAMLFDITAGTCMYVHVVRYVHFVLPVTASHCHPTVEWH